MFSVVGVSQLYYHRLLFFKLIQIDGCRAAIRNIHRCRNAISCPSRFKKFGNDLENAAAVIIMPTVIKAGFFAGGETGNGVLLKRNGNSNWSQPAYFTLAAASFGLQFGIQDTAIILVIRNIGALNSILDHQGKLGADTSAAIGTEGLGLEASTTSNLSTDIVAFASPNVGSFLGMSIEGAVLVTRHDLNEALYGKGAKPKAILNGDYPNPLVNALRSALNKK
jgi:lipid-binding SYLF domain-containing protein